MRFLTILPLIFLPFLFYGQSNEKSSESLDLELSVISGFNGTKLYLEDYSPKRGMRQFIGIQINRNFTENFGFGFSISRFKRSSVVSNVEFVKSGTEVNFFPKYTIGDISLYGGLQFISGNLSIESQPSYFDYQVDQDQPTDQINSIVGIDIQMAYRLNLFWNTSIKLDKKNESNWQVGVRYTLNGERRKPSYRRLKRLHAIEDIEAMKRGNVLVRLKTSQPKIDALKKVGKTEKAEHTAKEQREENLEIVKAFREEFNFTDVYFFYSHQSEKVKNNDLKKIFLSDNLELDTSIYADESKAVYIIELANIEPDTNQVFSEYRNKISGSFEQQRVPTYHGSPNHSFKGFVVKNQRFEQLLRPFPYYSRFILPSIKKHPEQLLFIGPLVIPLLSATSYEASIRNLNNKLHRFYNAKNTKTKRWYKRPYEFYEPHLPKDFNPPY